MAAAASQSPQPRTFGFLDGDRRQKVAILVILCVGAVLRLWQYFANSSLWLDEAALARNIVDRSATELLGPLGYGQVAPPAFLLIQRGIVATFGTSEYALRAFPLFCGLTSLLLFTAVARATLSGGAVIYAVLLFSIGEPFIYFSSQVKQYASDIAATLLALLACRWIAEGASDRWQRMLAAAGVLIPWLSSSASLVLVGSALGAVARKLWVRDRVNLISLMVALGLWTTSALAAGFFSIRNVNAESREFLDWFWRFGYAPAAPLALLQWCWDTLKDVYGTFQGAAFRTNGGLRLAWPALFAGTALIGTVQLVRRRGTETLILLVPIAAALFVSLLRLYPLSGRLLVFLVPVVLLATAAGADSIWTWFGRRARVAGVVIALVYLAIPIAAAYRTRPPYSVQPLRPVLERVVSLREPTDAIYVDYAASQAFLYYAPRLGLRPDDYAIGRCSLSDRRDYLRQVDRFRGQRRVWIIGTHLSAVERTLTVGYLERIGRRGVSIFEEPAGAPLRYAAYARLYDLSDPRRLAQSSAETHRFQELPLAPEVKRWGCFGPAVAE